MVSGIYLNENIWSALFVGYKKAKMKVYGLTLEDAQPNHAIRSSVAITKLLLACDILKKKNNNKKMEKCNFCFL